MCCSLKPAMSPDSVRRLTDLVMSACGGRAAVFAGSDEAGYKYAVGEQGGDLRQLVRELNTALQGRGGGKPFFAQGSVQRLPRGDRSIFPGKGRMRCCRILYPHIYHNEMAWKAPAPDDYALIFAPDGTVYCDLHGRGADPAAHPGRGAGRGTVRVFHR